MGRGGLEKVGPRRAADRDETLTAAFCAHEVRELARRWDEEAERDRPLAKRWIALRLALARCPDDAYEAARSAGAEILERAPIGLKCAIVASFPHEHAWAARVARELVAMPHPPICARHALVGIADPTLALELARLLVKTQRAWEVVVAAHGRILRMLSSEGHEPTILEAARDYGDEVVRAVKAVLVPNPRLDVPIKPPSIMKALRLDALPPPRLRSGAALTGDAVRNLAELLAVASDLVPYVGCDEVARACEPRSLEAFSWALFEAWTATGASTKSAWPLLALGIFGDDAVARELGPRLRGWAQQHKNVRALEGVRVLEAIASRGSDVAIMQLVNTAQGGVRSEDVKKRAEQALDAISGARGIDRDQLADRAAPTLGLDERGETILDFGTRKFTAVLAGSDVVVRDDGGQSHGLLPRASKDDDAKLAAVAQETWRALKLDAQEAFRAQTRRFEHALRTQRKWPRADVHDVLVRKRILLDLARRLVFSALEGTTPLFRFRITEDGTFADASDRPIDLARASHVVLAHPLDLDDEERARWGQHFADYELLQPFPQIGRETFALDEQTKSSPTTSRFGHAEVEPARLFALEMRGWTHFNDAFSISAGSDLYVSFVVGPGFQTRPIPKQSVSELRVMSRTLGAAPKLGDIDRITLSEILRDVATLA